MSDTSYSNHAGAIERVTVASERIVFRTTSEESAGALVVFDPGAEMERFARAAGALAATGRASTGGALRAAAAHGIQITRRVKEVA